MMNKRYFIGIDLGTSSCGFAVTDDQYHVIRKRKTDLMGVRLFKEAETAKKRRGYRTSRRRKQRDRVRRKYLRSIFEDEITCFDPDFFPRLMQSNLHQEDRSEGIEARLLDVSDSSFYEKYPTMSHLIMDLINHPEEKQDLRLVFLAVNHKFNHRGNFLETISGSSQTQNIQILLAELSKELFGKSSIENSQGMELNLESIKKLLASKEMKPSDKKSRLEGLLNDMSGEGSSNDKKKRVKEICKALSGNQFQLKKIFTEECDQIPDDLDKLKFSDASIEEKLMDLEEQVSEGDFSFISLLKKIFDWTVLQKLLTDSQGNEFRYLSESRIASYEKHKQDLDDLKKIMKAVGPDAYNQMFRVMEENNYSSYIGSVNNRKNKKTNKKSSVNGTAKFRGKKCKDKNELYKTIKKYLEEYQPETDEMQVLKDNILERIKCDNFLPKQMSAENGVIPNQLHLMELDQILQNAEKHYPFLKARKANGLTASEEIKALFQFRIPYYVGPLGDCGQPGFGWVKWKDGQGTRKVYPWTVKDEIDASQTKSEFIERLIRPCTYINEEYVLPDKSLIYEKFKVLNELNNLRVNGEKIPVEQKQAIFQSLFRKGGTVSKAKLLDFFVEKCWIAPEQKKKVIITGIDGKGFANKLESEKKFCNLFQTEKLSDEQIKLAERIIRTATIFSDSKPELKKELRQQYPELSTEQINKIAALSLKGWGKLSRKFLELEAENSNHERLTIMQALWNTNDNLMELLSSRYTFANELAKHQQQEDKNIFDLSPADLEGLYLSAPVKRMIWQAILVVRELRNIMGYDPDRIFIEMARQHDKNPKRTKSRRSTLENIYKEIKKTAHDFDWNGSLSQIGDSGLQKDKLYLYMLQQGRDLYTDEEIVLDKLMNDNSYYDIDHIYPQSKVMDDSLDNRVLVKKEDNEAVKKDVYPVPHQIQVKMKGFWEELNRNKLMSDEKFSRLIRKTPLSEEELAGFISRQLVETRQGTKVLASLVQQAFPDTEIVYSKASNITRFRKEFGFPKIRNLNNYHHAEDAYLNIVVGNTYFTKLTKNPYTFLRETKRSSTEYEYNLKKLFKQKVERNGEVAWIPQEESNPTVCTVAKALGKSKYLVSYKTYRKTGGIADQTIAPSGDANAKLPLAGKDQESLEKYGGYQSPTVSEYFLIDYNSGKEVIRELIPKPLYLLDVLNDKHKLEEYCEYILNKKNPVILLDSIKTKSLFRINGYYVRLAGKKDDKNVYFNDAVELVVPERFRRLVWMLTKTDGDKFKYIIPNLLKELNDDDTLLVELYDLIIDKYSGKQFQNTPMFGKKKDVDNRVLEKLKKNRNDFLDLNPADKVMKLHEYFINRNRATDKPDKMFMLAGNRVYISVRLKNWISKSKQPEPGQVVLVEQSVTGFYTKETDLFSL